MRLPVGVACGGCRRDYGMGAFVKRRVLGSTSSTTNRSHALFFGLSAYRRIPDLQAWNGNSLPPIPMQTPDHKQDEKSGWSRLKQVIDWSGMSVNRFAGAVGLQRSESLYQIKKGKNGISRRRRHGRAHVGCIRMTGRFSTPACIFPTGYLPHRQSAIRLIFKYI